MALSNRGRPICRAAIDFSVDPDKELYDDFYRACQTMGCVDIRRLAKALGIAESTIRFWKTTKTFPVTRGTAKYVIQWVEQGKPIEFVIQTPEGEQILRRSYAFN